jgi:formate hydrogenlyase subunit 3/multisubunit Na+/H+ antiporter MnhD subunit
MTLLLAALLVLLGGAALALLSWRADPLALRIAQLSSAAGCALGLVGSAAALLAGREESWMPNRQFAFGALRLGVDPLSALFLCIAFGVGLPASIYGGGYLRAVLGRKRVAWAAAAFNALLASVAAVFLARDGIAFAFAWEAMTLVAFALIAFEHERADVRRGAMHYLVFNHFGAACLFGFFAMLGTRLGTFALPAAPITTGQPLASILFLLALGGFGTKAGLVPLHVWLPEAHPVAPSHVSALLSAVMLKCGVYGLLRALFILGAPPAWWGWLLFGLGAVSAVVGALNLLAATDLKRCLAYSSVENVGIIAIALGLFVVARAGGLSGLAALALAGALLHALSHAGFKGLLFLGAGSVLHGAHTRALSKLGGLAQRMPATAALFLVGAAAAAAVPGLSGFASEWLVYRGLLGGFAGLPPAAQVAIASALAALALTGGLAAAGLARLFGVAFSGTPRSEEAAQAREQPLSLLGPMALLAAATAALGALPAISLRLATPVVEQFLGAGTALPAAGDLGFAAAVGFFFLAVAALFSWVRFAALRARGAAAGPTWGCGYPATTARMQYSAPSFGEPVAATFRAAFAVERRGEPVRALFPAAAERSVERADAIVGSGYQPLLSWISARFAALRSLHGARVQQYLLYLFFAVVALLLYASRLGRP